jgi:hypothetical protein
VIRPEHRVDLRAGDAWEYVLQVEAEGDLYRARSRTQVGRVEDERVIARAGDLDAERAVAGRQILL